MPPTSVKTKSLKPRRPVPICAVPVTAILSLAAGAAISKLSLPVPPATAEMLRMPVTAMVPAPEIPGDKLPAAPTVRLFVDWSVMGPTPASVPPETVTFWSPVVIPPATSKVPAVTDHAFFGDEKPLIRQVPAPDF